MAVGVFNSTMPGAVTPVCSSCGVHLCWDISALDYKTTEAFWDDWICEHCNGGQPLSRKDWQLRQKNRSGL